MAEFKISRLRFSWAGPWVDQTAYNKDEIVQYNGKAYVCLVPHTSNGFYNDLNAAEPKWELMMTGQTWKGVWAPTTFYSLDNIVIFGGIVYKCNEQHLSGAVLDTDIAKWDVYAESKTWQSEWTSTTTYGVGDIVQYGGSTYECIRSHVSADTDFDGLEADYLGLDSTLVKWKLVKESFQWRGEYSTSSEDSSEVRYKLNDLVKYGPSVYKCIEGYTPLFDGEDFSTNVDIYLTFDETKWELWMPGFDFDQVWDEYAIYQPGDVVLYGGYLFQSKVINNINNVPSFNSGDSSDAWEIIAQAYDMEGEWESTKSYRVGNVVTYGGDLYVAIMDSKNEHPGDCIFSAPYEADGSSGTTIKVDIVDSVDPALFSVGQTVTGEGFARGQTIQSFSVDGSIVTIILNEAPDGAITDGAILTFAGANSTFWELMIPGFNWKGKWEEGTLYNQDDVAFYGNATYRCVLEHTSTLVNRPDLDLQNAYWIVYLQHDKTNALSQAGEMIVGSSGKKSALSIGEQSQVLKVVGELPVWSDVDFTPNVYYVATNGVDDPDRGTTPDTAWASVKYACEQVAKGTGRQNEKALLEANKEWAIEDLISWMMRQEADLISPFDQSFAFDFEKTRRDARYIFDGVVTDLARNQTARTVANTLAYFDLESTNKYTNEDVAAQIEYFIAAITHLFENIVYALTNTVPATNWQEENNIVNPETQYFNNSLTIDADTLTFVNNLKLILVNALTAGEWANVPPANEGAYTTINVKSGTYNENLPLVLPARTALNGDELRGVVIQPANSVNTLCTRTFGEINQFVVGSTVNMEHNTPVQFVSLNPVDEISTIIGGDNIVQGVTYYVIGDSITDTRFSVSATPDGEPVELFTNIGYMYVYGGEALHDMIYVQNDTGIRNMTLTGLLGTLTPQNEYETRRPSGGAFVSFDPGKGPDDTTAWITRKSPYVQNVTNFGKGCVGMKIDSTLHGGGLRSMVCNDFTQVLSDGIGIWCTGGDALVECVSVFCYYNYAGYFAEDGGRIRATNGNSSYGKYGVVAEGFDTDEVPATGNINNRNNQALAEAVSALGANAEILKVQFNHAGSDYFDSTTNLMCHANNFLDSSVWSTDGNLNIIKAASTPFDGQDAWKIEGITSLTDSSYIYQQRAVAPQGKTYTNVEGENITGSGIGATFDITVYSDRYVVSVNNGGSGYVVGNQIRIPGETFGGRSVNDITITVDTLSITAILTIGYTGTVPEGSALAYTGSIYAKKGTAQYFDMYGIFTGYDTRSSYIRFNFDTETVSTSQLADSGTVPTYNIDYLDNDWYRISFTFWDETAQNTSLEFRIYPRGVDGIKGTTNFYGAQLQIGSEATFFLDTTANTPTAYANFDIQGSGSGVAVIADELRSGAIFQTRILESEQYVQGGLGYKTQTNNAQVGTDEYLTLAQSEVAEAEEYEGMRLSITSGKGSGQYGIISRYAPGTKNAYVLKESFETIEITATDATTDRFTIAEDADFYSMYVGQKIQFTPTYFDVTVTETAQDSVEVLGTWGDLNNLMIVSDTTKLKTGQKINFTGDVFGGVITDFDYYIINVVDSETIQISTATGGSVWPLNTVNIDDDGNVIDVNVKYTLNYPSNTSYLYATSTADMEIGYPIKFNGNSLGDVVLGDTYYIHDIYDANNFTISDAVTSVTATDTTVTTNEITILDTSVLVPMNPIIFSGTSFGGLTEKTRYWVNTIVDGTHFTVSDSVISTTATATQVTTNLITVTSTAGFTPGRPIVFTGTVFGGIVNDKVYYIQVVNDATSFTISETPGGTALSLTTATGELITRTPGAPITLSTDTGTLTGTHPGTKETVSSGSGEMGASFYTETYGGVSQGTTYYVLEKFEGATNEFTIESTLGSGTPVAISSDTGSMQIGEVGWDDINPGTVNTVGYDSTSVYTIEPRIKFTDPIFTQTEMSASEVGIGNWNIFVTNGFLPMIVPESGNTAYTTSDYTSWDTAISLPISGDTREEIDDPGNPGTLIPNTDYNGGWVSAAYGNNTWCILSRTGEMLYSVSNGLTWLSVTLPDPGVGLYRSVTYGNGVFVAIAQGSNTVSYSTNNCATWTEVNTAIGDEDWTDIAYGKETFVAISRSSSIIKYSQDDGVTWTESSLIDYGDSTIDNWAGIEYGNGRFVAVSFDERPPVYSFDGITWYASPLEMSGTQLTYGQGVFVALGNTSTCYTSENGIKWKKHVIDAYTYTAAGFTFDNLTKNGVFLTLAEQDTSKYASKISFGCRAQARALVDDTRITSIGMWEAGSGYDVSDSTVIPSISIIDPNNSQNVELQLRVGNGALGAPTFTNLGTGYNSSSTAIQINGGGYADAYQTGLGIICSNLTRIPQPGDNLQINGNDVIYRVARATILNGTTVPNLECEIRISPTMSQQLSPEHYESFTLRSRFSQVRLTNHDFLNIGYGNKEQSNYPYLPEDTNLEPQDEVQETNNGRVFYSSTDQDGNFRVGDLFAVEQATGIVTLSADEFGLEGLTELSIGGVALGGSPVVVNEFSTDGTFVANSNQIVPTQKAIRTYLASRLSQGGSDTFTGLLTAGTVKVGGPDEITTAVPEGAEGWQVKIGTKANVSGPLAAWAGDGAAMAYFMKTFVDPTRSGQQ